MKQKPKELDWEKEFDEMFIGAIRYEDGALVYQNDLKTAIDLKQFIQSLLTQQRTELENKFKLKDTKQ